MTPPARDAWLITGIPGASKSTIARGLAGRLPSACILDAQEQALLPMLGDSRASRVIDATRRGD